MELEKKLLITVTGPSLTGKTTMAQMLKEYGYEELVSTTTRPPRKGEVDGVHYHFVTREDFNKMDKNGEMIETVEVNGNFYGLSRKSLEDVLGRGSNAVVVAEPQGVKQVQEYCSKHGLPTHSVFLDNPTELLVSRFLHRFANDDKVKQDEKAYNAYVHRVIGMLTKEPKEWIEPAYNGEQKYDQVFKQFTKDNEHEVLKEILVEVKNKNENKTKKKIKNNF